MSFSSKLLLLIFTLTPKMQKNESNSAEESKRINVVRKEKASVENVKTTQTSEIMVLKLNNHLLVGIWRRHGDVWSHL